MLTKIKNEFMYTDLKRQMIFVIIFAFIGLFWAYSLFIKPMSSDLTQEIKKYNQLKGEVLIHSDKGYMSESEFKNLIEECSESLKLVMKMDRLSPGHVNVLLMGDFNKIIEFIDKIGNFHKNISVESLIIEKKNRIQAEMILVYLEDHQDD